MISRRTLLAALGGTAALAGCVSTTEQPSQTTDTHETDREQSTVDNEPPVEPPDRTDPIAVVRGFYEALFTGDIAALNEWYVHPESPTYPVESEHVPPSQFDQIETATIVSMEEVSVQDRVVQQLFADVGRSSRIRRQMGAQRLQYIHTTFYVTLTDDESDPTEVDTPEIDIDDETVDHDASDDPELNQSTSDDSTVTQNETESSDTESDEPTVYVADTVDYLVRDDGHWYVRYDST